MGKKAFNVSFNLYENYVSCHSTFVGKFPRLKIFLHPAISGVPVGSGLCNWTCESEKFTCTP